MYSSKIGSSKDRTEEETWIRFAVTVFDTSRYGSLRRTALPGILNVARTGTGSAAAIADVSSTPHEAANPIFNRSIRCAIAIVRLLLESRSHLTVRRLRRSHHGSRRPPLPQPGCGNGGLCIEPRRG